MKSRVFLWCGITAVVLLITDLLCYAALLRHIHQMGESYPHDGHTFVFVHIERISDPFGNPWWVLPLGLSLAAAMCFALSRRSRAPAINQ